MGLELRALKAKPVRLAPRAIKATPEIQARRGLLVTMGHRGQMALKARKAPKVRRARLAKTAQRARMGLRGLKVFRALLETALLLYAS